MKSTIITCEQQQDKVILADTGRAILNLNEREVEVEEMNGDETATVKKYQYDSLILDAPVLSVDAALAAVKALKIADIESYDKSDSVNTFTLEGEKAWYSKADRLGLINGITQQKNSGEKQTTLWNGTSGHVMDVDDALDLLSKLELYAIGCNDTTRSHLAEVAALGDIESVFNYDITEGYPDKLTF